LIYPLKIVIFHSYVSLPEGTDWLSSFIFMNLSFKKTFKQTTKVFAGYLKLAMLPFFMIMAKSGLGCLLVGLGAIW